MQNKKSYLEARRNELEASKKALAKLRERYSQGEKGAGEAVNSALQTVEDKMRQASEGLANLKDAAAENWETVKAAADRAFEEVKEAFKQISAEASHSPVIQPLFDSMKSTEKYIQKNPLGSAFIALGVGFVLGRMLKS